MRPATLRPLLALALLGGFVAAAPSEATAPCRPLLQDPAGDATVADPSTGTQLLAAGNDPALDLLSADVVSDRRSFTVVVRTAADMRTSQDRAGHSIELVFRAIGEHRWNASADFQGVGPMETTLSEASSEASASGAIDGDGTLSADGRTLRLRYLTDAFTQDAGRPLRIGDLITGLHLYSNRSVMAEGTGFFSPMPADTATTTSAYRSGAHACISP